MTKKKRDTGVAILPNGYPIQEELRDKLVKRDWSKPRREIKSQSVFATLREMKEGQFSGFYVNEFTGYLELWLLGEVITKERCIDIVKNPGLIGTMHERAFNTKGTVIELDSEQVAQTLNMAKRLRGEHGKSH